MPARSRSARRRLRWRRASSRTSISTDIHQMSVAGPMFDLPTCLSKFLALGLEVREVVAMATAAAGAHPALRGSWHAARRRAGRHRACSGCIRARSRSTTIPARCAPVGNCCANVRDDRRGQGAGTPGALAPRGVGGAMGSRWNEPPHARVPVRFGGEGPYARADVWMREHGAGLGKTGPEPV